MLQSDMKVNSAHTRWQLCISFTDWELAVENIDHYYYISLENTKYEINFPIPFAMNFNFWSDCTLQVLTYKCTVIYLIHVVIILLCIMLINIENNIYHGLITDLHFGIWLY